MSGRLIEINQEPVLTLWAAIVAERLGFDREEALTIGQAVAGSTAHGQSANPGLYQPTPSDLGVQRKRLAIGDELRIEFLQRAVSVSRTRRGLRALDTNNPIDPASVEHHLASEFGSSLGAAREAMIGLAGAFPPLKLATIAYLLYQQFRPEIPRSATGPKTLGVLDLDAIARLARGW
jgi:hypothetical protein